MKYLSFIILSFYSLWGYSWPEDSTLESSSCHKLMSEAPVVVERRSGDDMASGPYPTAFQCIVISVSPKLRWLPYYTFQPIFNIDMTHLWTTTTAIIDGAPNCPDEPKCIMASNGTFTLGPAEHCVLEYRLEFTPDHSFAARAPNDLPSWVIFWNSEVLLMATYDDNFYKTPYNFISRLYALTIYPS